MAVQFKDLDTYYDTPSRHGEYQYTTIKDIVNNFMYSQDNDSYVANVDRNRVVYHAKRNVQELYYDVVNEIISIELELSPRLTIPLPHDFINYVRISWVDECGKLHPLAIDLTSNLSQAYLQDNEYNLLFDGEGDILEGTHRGSASDCDSTRGGRLFNEFESYVFPYFEGYTNNRRAQFNVDRSKLFKNGSYRIDKDRGIIQFSSDVSGRVIVLEYLSDGLFQRDDGAIRIHKFAEECMYAYVYWMLISNNRNVPANEKERARREFYNQRRIAKRRIQPIRYEELRQVMKGQTRWIKD